MAGWRGSRAGAGGDGSPSVERIPSSQTVRLGKVQPQAPGHRTVFCNDREANALTKFKVSFLMLIDPLFIALIAFVSTIRFGEMLSWVYDILLFVAGLYMCVFFLKV